MSRDLKPVRVDGDVAYVPLTRGLEAIIDAEDAALVGQWNWYALVAPHGHYAIRIVHSKEKRCAVYLHRLLLEPPKGLEVDHINGNPLDNRRENLRLATRAQNNYNQVSGRKNTSGFKGVCWDKKRGMWKAQIRANGINYNIGHYPTPEEAHEAYKLKALELHGEYANFSI